MAYCTLADVKAFVKSKTVSDDDIENIIDAKTAYISARTGASLTAPNNSLLFSACVNASVGAVIRKMKITGEMAASRKMGNFQQNNQIDPDIQAYEAEAERFIKMYRFKNGGLTVFSRAGPGTVNAVPNNSNSENNDNSVEIYQKLNPTS